MVRISQQIVAVFALGSIALLLVPFVDRRWLPAFRVPAPAIHVAPVPQPWKVPSPSPDPQSLAGVSTESDQVLVVVAHDQANPEESVAWVKHQPHPYVVMKQGQRGVSSTAAKANIPIQAHSLPSNHGGPAASYMQFILENYQKLPAIMIFTPAVDYFAGLYTKDILRELDPHAYKFVRTADMWRHMGFSEESRGLHKELRALYNGTDLQRHLGLPPAEASWISTACCGSIMVVARSRVLSRPKEVYQLLFDLMYTWRENGQLGGPLAQLGPDISQHMSILLDYQWHYLWGQQWPDSPPDKEVLYPCRSPWRDEAFLKQGRKCRSPTPSPSASPSVFLPEQGPGAWQPVPSSSHPNPDNETVLVIARNRLKDGFLWLNEQPYRYVLMEKGLREGTPNNLPLNRGLDSSSYLQFILEHWESLPARMIFLHGHRDDQGSGNYVDMLHGLDVYRFPFVGVARLWLENLSDVPEHPLSPHVIQNVFIKADLQKYLGMPPQRGAEYSMDCCSNFLVTRERVKARPRELYERLFNATYVAPVSDVNMMLEMSWGFILGQPWRDSKPNVSEMFPHFQPWDHYHSLSVAG